MPTLRILSRSGRELSTVDYNDSTTVADIKSQFARSHPKYGVDRQYLTIGLDNKSRIVLQNDKPLSTYHDALKAENNTVYFKDLGPQISWRTVFYIEYLGPILIHTLNFFFPVLFYGSTLLNKRPHTGYPLNYHPVQIAAYLLVVFHYLKREFETHYIHRFSNATMPILNIFKNSTHYWIFGGVMISYFLYHPLYTPPQWLYRFDTQTNNIILAVASGLMLICELGNLHAHIILRNLRPPGTRTRGIPRGNLFSLVACANYFWEVNAWVVFSIMTQVSAAYLFTFISTAQIAQWAIKKHVALKKEFGKANTPRYALFPYLF